MTRTGPGSGMGSEGARCTKNGLSAPAQHKQQAPLFLPGICAALSAGSFLGFCQSERQKEGVPDVIHFHWGLLSPP
jgi:hypothetical protein